MSTTVVRLPLGYDDTAVYRTVKYMVQVILLAYKDPVVRDAAKSVLQYCAPYDVKCELQSIFSFVQQHVRYTRDPEGQEYLQTPQLLLFQMGPHLDQRAIGDCDDMVMLLLSMLKSVGYPVALRVTAYATSPPTGGPAGIQPDYSHVYGLVRARGQWIAVDPIRPTFVVGSEGPTPARAVDVPIGAEVPVWLAALADGVV